MSEFNGQKMRAIGFEVIYDVADTISDFGPSVELRDEDGNWSSTVELEAFRNGGLYEIVE